MAARFIVVVDETKLVDRLGPVRHPDRGARLRPRRWSRRRVRALGRPRGRPPAPAQRQRQPGDGRPLRPHRRPGGAGRPSSPRCRASSSTASSPARWSSGWWWRQPTASASWSTTRPDPRSVGARLSQRPRYWARAPTASLLSRLERCRPSSTNSTALATIGRASRRRPQSASTGSRSAGRRRQQVDVVGRGDVLAGVHDRGRPRRPRRRRAGSRRRRARGTPRGWPPCSSCSTICSSRPSSMVSISSLPAVDDARASRSDTRGTTSVSPCTSVRRAALATRVSRLDTVRRTDTPERWLMCGLGGPAGESSATISAMNVGHHDLDARRPRGAAPPGGRW